MHSFVKYTPFKYLIYFFIVLSIDSSISIFLFTHIYLFVCLFIYLFIRLFIYGFYLFIHLLIYLIYPVHFYSFNLTIWIFLCAYMNIIHQGWGNWGYCICLVECINNKRQNDVAKHFENSFYYFYTDCPSIRRSLHVWTVVEY